jgi:hypothetical protein
MHVLPQLAMRAGRIVAKIDVLVPRLHRRVRRGPLRIRRAEIGKLLAATLAAMRTGNAHRVPQCRLG